MLTKLRTGILIALLFTLITAVFTPVPGRCQASRPMDVVILLDRSGSMLTTDPEGLGVAAASFVVDQLSLANRKNRVAVVTFSSHVYILGQKKPNPSGALSSNLAGICEMLAAGISKRSTYPFREIIPSKPDLFYRMLKLQMHLEEYTELGKALKLAGEILKNSGKERRKVILLISDGKPEPNIRDPERLKELSSILGKGLVERVKRRGSEMDIMNLNRAYADYILKHIVPSLASEGVEIYPVAFHRKGMTPEALVNYLKRIKRITTGDENIIVADADDLIPKLIDFIPPGAGYMRVLYNLNFVKGSPETREAAVRVPDVALRTRFSVFYRNARPSQKPRIRIYRSGTLVADSMFPDRFPGAVFISSRKRNGGLVFQSVRVDSHQNAHGSFTISITDESVGKAEGIPDAGILVDAQCRITPYMEIEPEPVRAKMPFEARVKLLARTEKGELLLPVTSAFVFFVGRKPESVLGYSERVRNVTYRKGVAVLKLEDGLPNPGSYDMRAKLLFRPPGFRESFPIRFSIPINVTSSIPLAGNVWIAKKGIKGLMGRESEIVLPPLGERFKVVYSSLVVKTSLPQVIDGLRLKLPPFRHSETGATLGDIARSWASVAPKVVMGLSRSRPVPLKLIISIPSEVPQDIPDGLYRSDLELKDGTNTLYSLPVSVWVSIPRFVMAKEEVKKNFSPESPPRGTVKKTIMCPGSYPRKIKIRLWSTSISGTRASVVFDDRRGIETVGEGEERRVEKLLFGSLKKEFKIPGRNSKDPGTVVATVRLEDPSLNGRTFYNTAYITGPHHRELPVKLVVKVRFIPTWMLRIAYILIAVWAILALSRFMALQKLKYLFKGSKISLDIPGSLTGRYGSMGEFWIEENSLYFQPPAGGYEAYIEDGGISVNIDGRRRVIQGDTLGTSLGKERFRFVISDIDIADGKVELDVTESPLSKRGMMFYLSSGLVLAIMALVGIVKPYLIIQMLKIL